MRERENRHHLVADMGDDGDGDDDGDNDGDDYDDDNNDNNSKLTEDVGLKVYSRQRLGIVRREDVHSLVAEVGSHEAGQRLHHLTYCPVSDAGDHVWLMERLPQS